MTRVLLLSTSDTDLLSAKASGADFRLANPNRVLLDELPGMVAEADVVVVRVLGGYRYWEDGLDLLRAGDTPLVALGGEMAPDAEMMELSSVPAGVAAEAHTYLAQGGTENLRQLHAFLSDTVLLTGEGFAPPIALPEWGVLERPDARVAQAPSSDARATQAPSSDACATQAPPSDACATQAPPSDASATQAPPSDARATQAPPTVAVLYYRAQQIAGNVAYIEALCQAIEARGATPLPIFCASLRQAPAALLETLRAADAMIVTVLAAGGTKPASAQAGGEDEEWDVTELAALDVPILQGLCLTSSRATWECNDDGLSPLDVATQVAVPEFDGRLITVPFSFKEIDADGLSTYVPDPERAARVAGIAVRHAELRRIPNADKKIVLMLSAYPTKHARIGNAVGLDTPASTVALLKAMAEAGYDAGEFPGVTAGDGDALIHALIEAGGQDPDWLTEEKLAGNPIRISAEQYRGWFDTLPQDLREAVTEHWGPPPGEHYVQDGDIVVAALRSGNVTLMVQPPRGFGENPVAIYHDPDLPPSHHYLAAYRWVAESFGAHAIVHIGKHGNLEWLPGKTLGMSASCGVDAALGDLPLIYPFLVNDPGEGTQAKRRAHATLVDHLIPPMARAETYGDISRLEQLLDEHANVSALDPAKLPAIRQQIWTLMQAAKLDHDLGLEERPHEAEFDDFLLHVDGWLCEIKDVQIRDGLHVLAAAPDGDTRVDLVLAMLRARQMWGGEQSVPGLREALGLVEDGSEAKRRVDEIESLAHALIADMEAAGWDPDAAADVVDVRLGSGEWGTRAAEVGDSRTAAASPALPTRESAVLDARVGHGGARGGLSAEDLERADTVERILRFAATEVVPRLAETAHEIDRVLHALDGGFIPAGPSGSPLRGLINVLPTGRNFYSVDPKAVPSKLAWETGQAMAESLVDRYRRDHDGEYPRSVGLSVWGTSAMRTSGDDVAEVFALLGVRPVWDEMSRRVTRLEVIGLDELQRPRIDVTVRISGFFRDAFPHVLALLDDAVQLVSDLDETAEQNFVKAHVLADEQRTGDRRRATTRIFGSKPGTYGAGLLQLVDSKNWRDDADLAEVYTTWGGYAYGRGLDGAPARDDMETAYRRIAVAAKNTDTREHDIADSDDYYQYHGGMVATVRALTGTAPEAYIGDSTRPESVKTRTLHEETARVFRARVVNPRWIEAMRRHGYKGAFEMAATVDYLFGWDATTGVVADWQYEKLTETYVLDPDNRKFLSESNPWALHGMAERLLEAVERKLWEAPEQATLDALRQAYLETEGDLEEE